MRTYAALALLMTLIAAASASAQQCYTPVTGWQGSYNLATNATGTCAGPNGNSGTCTWSQGAIGGPNFRGVSGGCSQLSWGSTTDSVTSFSMSDMGTWSCAPESGTLTETWVGNSGSSSSSL